MDLLVLTPGSDLRYLTGYNAHAHGAADRLAVPARGRAVPRRAAAGGADGGRSPAGGLGLERAGLGRDRRPVRAARRRRRPRGSARAGPGRGRRPQLGRARPGRPAGRCPGRRWSWPSPVVDRLRMVKSAAEIEELREAGAAIDRVHARMGEWLRVGRTEARGRRRHRRRDPRRGARQRGLRRSSARARTAPARTTSCPTGSIGPATSSSSTSVAGRPTGYCSDCTRTYVVGGAPRADVAECYGVLQAAQAAATAAVRPGVTAEAIDAAARDVIADAGYGEQFIHRTGHGIGLETHEEPYIVEGNDMPLEPGMAFSIEPGIYPRAHGARIEDIVVCTEDGVSILNDGPRDLVELPG